MLFVELPNEDVQMFYRSNLPGDDEYGRAITPNAPLPSDRETILLLPGTMLDSRDMSEILASPLSKRYNLVVLDPRSVGQTKNPPSAARDAWVDAADFVKAMEVLGIESAHVMAVSGLSVVAAKRMAVLWPERVKSLVLIAIAPPDPPEWIMESWNELLGIYLNAKDLETMEECINDFYPLAYGEYLCPAKVDEVALYWETQYHPANGARFYDWATPFLLRQRLGAEFLRLIRQPTLIMNGASTLVSSPEEAERLQASMVSVTGGTKLVIVPDAPDQFHYIPQFAVIVVDEMTEFYRNLPQMEPRPFLNEEKDPWKRALFELAELRNDPSIKERDPHRCTSFSGVPPEIVERRKQGYVEIAKASKGAFSPFGPNGEPPRKFSERHMVQIAQDVKHSRARANSGLWANGVELEIVESDEEPETPTKQEDLRIRLARELRSF